MVDVELKKRGVYLGKTGETGRYRVWLDVSAWDEEYEGGVGLLLYTDPKGNTAPMRTVKEFDGEKTKLYGYVTAEETKEAGTGVIEARWENAGVVAKSDHFNTVVMASSYTGKDIGENTPEWVSELMTELNAVNVVLEEAAQVAEDVAAIRETIEGAETVAKAAALDSEAWAVGERDGEDVDEDDPTYGNNARKYAQDAGGSAAAAGVYKLEAEAWAKGTKNGTAVGSTDPAYQKNAKYYAEQAFSGTPEGYAELVGDVGDLKSAIEESATVHPVILQSENEYIAIGSSGSTIGNPTSRTGYQYAIVPCQPGDEFLMESLAVESGIRVWGFADANKAVIKNTNGNIAEHQFITAPSDSAYFIFNNKTGDGTVYRGNLAPTDNQTRNPGSPIPMRRMGPNGNKYFSASVTKIDFTATYDASNARYIALVPCSAFDVFTINAHGGNFDRAYAFTKKDGTVLSSADAGADLKNYQVTAPANAAYLLLQDQDGQTSYFGPTSALPALKSDIDTAKTEIDAEIDGVSDRVDSCDEDIEQINKGLYNEAITGWVTGNLYINTGISDLTQSVNLTQTYSGTGYRYVILDCNAGDSFILNASGGTYPRAYAFLDSGNLILERADSSAGFRNQVITAPTNSAKLVLNDNSGLTSYYGTKSITYRVGELEALGAVPGKLVGKVMVNFGDSVFGRGQGATGISGRLAYKTGATVHNLGMSGTSISTRNSVPGYDAFNLWRMADAITTGTYTDQDAAISQYTDKPGQAASVIAFLKTFDFSTVDYATIGLGTNDWGGNGQTLDNPSNQYDKTTVCGALRYSIEKLLTAFPKIIIVILSTIPRFSISGGVYTEYGNNSGGYSLIDLNAKLKEVADAYRLKFIDDYYIGFNKWTCPQYYASGDGTHPDIPGFEIVAENISAHL